MEKSTAKRSSSNILIFLILLTITLLVYVPGLNQLGFYRDDWNNMFNAYTQGADMLIPHYASDRPVDGYLLRTAYELFGANLLPYLIINLICRFLCGVLFYLSLMLIWRKHKFPAFVAAALFLIFPGFLRQVDGFAYLPHQIAMLSILLSIYLSLLALQAEKMGWKIALALISITLASVEMALMEYYIGMEALRFLLFYAWLYNRSAAKPFEIFLKTLVNYLPWLLGAIAFFVWRSFFFEASRRGTDVKTVLRPFFDYPRYTSAIWLSGIIRNIFKVMVGSWTVPLYNLFNSLDVKVFWNVFGFSLIPGVVFLAAFLKLMPERLKPLSLPQAPQKILKRNWRVQWMILGLLGCGLALVPIILAGREVTFSSSLDRFAYPACYGAILFTVGLVASIEGKWVKTALLTLMVFSGIMAQLINKENYIKQTRLTNDFWWQLSWRVPQIEKDTLLMTAIYGFSPEEDYEIFAPLHLIYYPNEDHVQVGNDNLNAHSKQKAAMGTVESRTVRMIFLSKDYTKMLAVTKPSAKSCVQVIDGENPIYSNLEGSRISEIGQYSLIDRALIEHEFQIPPTAFFGREPEKGWCYYYEKMALAHQQEEWETVVSLADEAIAAGMHAEDAVEWLPAVQAYAYLGRLERAEPYGEILKTDSYLQFQTCNYFKNALDLLEKGQPSAEAQQFLIEKFCE